MKRSLINDILQEGDAFIKSFGFTLPPFAWWSPEEMEKNDHKLIKERSMGWDITDYGQEKFDELGLFLFTVRNGDFRGLGSGTGMLYAEKIMISRDKQLSPMHQHFAKAEDIINRGGGDLVIELYSGDKNGRLCKESDVTVPVDGRMVTMSAGSHLCLKPGESVTLLPGTWHAFWGEKGDVLVGEVSTVNDDHKDNDFYEDLGRFSNVEEDVAPRHLLVSDYEKWLS